MFQHIRIVRNDDEDSKNVNLSSIVSSPIRPLYKPRDLKGECICDLSSLGVDTLFNTYSDHYMAFITRPASVFEFDPAKFATRQLLIDGWYDMFMLKPGYKELNRMIGENLYSSPEWDTYYRTVFRGLPILKEVNFDEAFQKDRKFEISAEEFKAVVGLDDNVDLIMGDNLTMTS